MQQVRRTMCSLVAMVAMASTLMLDGCASDVEQATAQATANDVNNQAFTFASGEVLHASLAHIETTLMFTNNATTFTLSSTGEAATGTNSFGSCILTVMTSTYPTGTGPQVNDVIPLSPCDFDSANNTLIITNGSITATSAPAVPIGTGGS